MAHLDEAEAERRGYGPVSRFNHWAGAVAIIALVATGLASARLSLPDETRGALMDWHRAAGALLLAFAVWRVGWRLVNGFPPHPPGLPRWQANAATAVHWSLLVLVVALPVSGIVMTVFRGRAVQSFGFAIPAGPEIAWLAGLARTVHEVGGLALALLIGLHAAAAVKHALIDGDGSFARMLAGRGW